MNKAAGEVLNVRTESLTLFSTAPFSRASPSNHANPGLSILLTEAADAVAPSCLSTRSVSPRYLYGSRSGTERVFVVITPPLSVTGTVICSFNACARV